MTIDIDRSAEWDLMVILRGREWETRQPSIASLVEIQKLADVAKDSPVEAAEKMQFFARGLIVGDEADLRLSWLEAAAIAVATIAYFNSRLPKLPAAERATVRQSLGGAASSIETIFGKSIDGGVQ